MGCVSSTLLNQDDDFPQLGGAAFSHHIVSLTSTTYGLLTLDPPSSTSSNTTLEPPTPTPTPTPTPPPRVTLGSLFPSPLSEPRSLRYQPLVETINSWDLMSGLLDSSIDHIPSFRFPPDPHSSSKHPKSSSQSVSQKENLSPNYVSKSKDIMMIKSWLEKFEPICPPNGENKVVLYSTTLRGVRKTFEDCNAVRSAIESLGVSICERDISMDRGFKEELRELMKGKGTEALIPPRVFVKGRYIGGVEEVMRIVEEGCIGELLQELPRVKGGVGACEGCGGVRFLPCFTCNGSCKMVMVVKEVSMEDEGKEREKSVVVRCSDCNENGLVLCPICT